MDEFVFVHKLQRAIKQRLAALSINVTSGGVDNFDKYKYITGQISALESVLQEISNLLNKKELLLQVKKKLDFLQAKEKDYKKRLKEQHQKALES